MIQTRLYAKTYLKYIPFRFATIFRFKLDLAYEWTAGFT